MQSFLLLGKSTRAFECNADENRQIRQIIIYKKLSTNNHLQKIIYKISTNNHPQKLSTNNHPQKTIDKTENLCIITVVI